MSELITFKKAVEIRKWIRVESWRIQKESEAPLTKDEIDFISRQCQDSIVPGMRKDDVPGRITKALQAGIKMVMEQRFSSSIAPNTDNLLQNQAAP